MPVENNVFSRSPFVVPPVFLEGGFVSNGNEANYGLPFFFNGFDVPIGATFARASAKTAYDADGNLVTVPSGVFPAAGGRWATTLAEGAELGPELAPKFLPTDEAGDYLSPASNIATRQGMVKQFDYAGEQKGFQCEPARTNLVYPSNTFSSWENNGISTVAVASDLSPNGRTMWQVEENGTSNIQWYLRRATYSIETDTQYTISCCVKKAERTYISIYPQGDIVNSQTYLVFNFDTQSVETVNNIDSYFIESIGDDAYRISIVITTKSSGSYIYAHCYASDSGVPAQYYTGIVGTICMYIWDYQIEKGSFPTSVIETTSTTVTRLADVLSVPCTGRIRSQNCAIRGLVRPMGAEQNKVLFGTQSDTDNHLQVVTSGGGTSIDLVKTVAGSAETVSVAYTLDTDICVEYMALWTDYGMAIRYRTYDGLAYSEWSAWSESTDDTAAILGDTFEIGGKAGVDQFAGWYQSCKSKFLPTLDSLSEHEVEADTSKLWQDVAA